MSARPDRTIPGVSRRSVVRATAWSVPAITVATAAPAFAVSGGLLQYQVAAPLAQWRHSDPLLSNEYLRVDLTVTNLSTTTAMGQLTIALTFPEPWVTGALNFSTLMDIDAISGSFGSGWSRNGQMSYLSRPRQGYQSFTHTPQLAAGGTTPKLQFIARASALKDMTEQPNLPIQVSVISPPTGFTASSNSITSFTPVIPPR